MTSMLRLLLLVLLLGSIRTYGAARELCRTSIPLAMGRYADQLPASELTFVSNTEGSSPFVTVTNRTEKSVSRIIIVAELVDKGRHYQLTVPLVAAVPGKLPPERLALPIVSRKTMDKPVLPGETVALVTGTQYSVAQCPIEARAVLVNVDFSDGTEMHHTAPRWGSLASVNKVEALELKTFPGSLPVQAVVNLSVSADGRPLKISAPEQARDVGTWFQVQLATWRFNPAVMDGRRVPSQVTIAFRLHTTLDRTDLGHFDDDVFQRHPAVIPVDIYWDGAAGLGGQAIYVAGLPLVLP